MGKEFGFTSVEVFPSEFHKRKDKRDTSLDEDCHKDHLCELRKKGSVETKGLRNYGKVGRKLLDGSSQLVLELLE